MGGLPGLAPILRDTPSGKVLRAGDRLFTYDAWGRVKTVASSSSAFPAVTYEYDALGRKFSAATATDVRYFDYDGEALLGEQLILTGSSEHNPDDLVAACLDGEISLDEALDLASLSTTTSSNSASSSFTQSGGGYRTFNWGPGGVLGHTESVGTVTYVYSPDNRVVGVYGTNLNLSPSQVTLYYSPYGADALGNPMASGGAANAPPYGVSPFGSNGGYVDPNTGLQSSAGSGMEGAYDPRAGGDVEDDLLGENGENGLYRGFLSAVNTGAGYAKEVLATAADLHPFSAASELATGKDAHGKQVDRKSVV